MKFVKKKVPGLFDRKNKPGTFFSVYLTGRSITNSKNEFSDGRRSARSGYLPRPTRGADTQPRAVVGSFLDAPKRQLTSAYWAGRSELKLTAIIAQAPPGGRLNTTSCFPWSVALSVNAMS